MYTPSDLTLTSKFMSRKRTTGTNHTRNYLSLQTVADLVNRPQNPHPNQGEWCFYNRSKKRFKSKVSLEKISDVETKFLPPPPPFAIKIERGIGKEST